MTESPDDERPSREQHLEWCKKRALEYVDEGNLVAAGAAMSSDLGKHPETAHSQFLLMEYALLCTINHDADGMRRWITGFR